MRNYVETHPITYFFILTYAITWTCWLSILVIFGPYLDSPELAPITLLIIGETLAKIGACGPAISAIILIAIMKGKEGLREFFARVFRFKVTMKYYLAAFLIPVSIYAFIFMIELILGGSFPGTFAEYGLIGFIIHYIIRFSLGNFEEEMGWRGFAQHRLQNKYSPLKMSLMIAIPHATWHLPMFLIEYGSIDPTNFLVYTIMVVFLTFIITWLYAKTESVFLAGLLHTTFNECSLFLALSTDFGDIILLITVAIVGIILIRFFTPDKTSIEILDESRASDNLTLETGL